MKKIVFVFVSLILIMGIVLLPPNNQAWLDHLSSKVPWVSQDQLVDQTTDQQPKDNQTSTQEKEQSTSQTTVTLDVQEKEKIDYVRLSDLDDQLSIRIKTDDQEGQVVMTQGESKVSFTKDIAVAQKNGTYHSMPAPLLYQEDELWIPVSTFEKLFTYKVASRNENQAQITAGTTAKTNNQPKQMPKMNKDELIRYLSFLENPITGAHVSTQDSSLPGAPRTYRKGVHEGIDWYGGQTTGIPVDRNTPIKAIADGTIIRADHDYQEMSPMERQRVLIEGRRNDGQTPAYLLDRVRGRSVWIQHERGVMARYVHLDRIPEQLQVGQKVKQGDTIGYVGNSGTSDGAKGNDQGLHLHMDLFIYGTWFWDQFSMDERREILETVFSPEE